VTPRIAAPQKSMGVYVFRSRCAPFLKVGHYAGANAWSRVAHRGFFSCRRPAELEDRVGVDDLELVAWFPSLPKATERLVKQRWRRERARTEWYPAGLEGAILAFLRGCGGADAHEHCSKELALATRHRR
jgi:hypothetical protein